MDCASVGLFVDFGEVGFVIIKQTTLENFFLRFKDAQFENAVIEILELHDGLQLEAITNNKIKG